MDKSGLRAKQQISEEENESYAYAHPSWFSRCNCAGNKRATLRGLIELFEQQQVATPTVTNDNHSDSDSDNEQREDRQESKRSNELRRMRSKREKLSTRERVAKLGVPVLPTGPELTQKLTSTSWAPATDGRQYEHKLIEQNIIKKNNKQEEHNNSHIIKHQLSSSRRLLNQLAKLRKLSEPEYQVRRPEKVAQVERLIEELERLTSDWEQDERLLDRADRRDLPERYQRSANPSSEYTKSQISESPEQTYSTVRTDVDEEEEIAIASAHSTLARESNFNRNRRRDSARRRVDDLAVRRLSSSSDGKNLADMNAKQKSSKQMSYLLCSGAGAYYNRADILGRDDALEGDAAEIERRLMNDDLHVRTRGGHSWRSQSPEPPFGIPRRPLDAPTIGTYPTRNSKKKQQQQRRSESRVSFASVDSGLVACDSPDGYGISTKARSAGHRRVATPSSSSNVHQDTDWEYADLDECDLSQLGIRDANESCSPEFDEQVVAQESGEKSETFPVVQLCRTELLATLSPKRARIRIEQPRSKSPLLRVGSAETGTNRHEELECRYQFEEDDDDDDDNEDDYEYGRLSGRSSANTSNPNEQVEGPRFSIGQYESSRARSRRLKILH